MTLFAGFLLLVYLIIVIRGKNKREKFIYIVIVSAVCSIYVEAGYFLVLGDKEIDYGDFGLIISFIWAIYILFTTKVKKTNTKLIFLSIFITLIGLFGLIFWPYKEPIVTGDSISYDMVAFGIRDLNYAVFNSGNVIKSLFLIMYYIVCLALYGIINEEYKQLIIKCLYKVTKIVIILGIVEWIYAYLLHAETFRTLVNNILGYGSQYRGLIIRNDSFMLQGLCREASHYLFGLYISAFVLYLMYDKYKEKKAILWGILLCFIAICSTSLSAIMYAFFVYIILFLYKVNKNNTPKKRIISFMERMILGLIIGIVAITILLGISSSSESYTLQRVNNLSSIIEVLFSDIGFSYIGRHYSSELIRFYSIICTIKNWIHRPLFGFGMGTTICHSSTLQFLTDVGLVGMYLWYRVHVNMGTKEKGFYKIAVSIYILSNLFSSMYLVPYVGNAAVVIMILFDVMFYREGELADEKS